MHPPWSPIIHSNMLNCRRKTRVPALCALARASSNIKISVTLWRISFAALKDKPAKNEHSITYSQKLSKAYQILTRWQLPIVFLCLPFLLGHGKKNMKKTCGFIWVHHGPPWHQLPAWSRDVAGRVSQFGSEKSRLRNSETRFLHVFESTIFLSDYSMKKMTPLTAHPKKSSAQPQRQWWWPQCQVWTTTSGSVSQWHDGHRSAVPCPNIL